MFIINTFLTVMVRYLLSLLLLDGIFRQDLGNLGELLGIWVISAAELLC